ncbi:MAG: PEGA domain-containing protein [Deltaproteobacteria bacterium]|nr:PEGA domain-containing protein [Deltaproteobacteria bacterium]
MAPAAAFDTDAKLAEAKKLFGQGNELRRAGDCQAALPYYVRSRALVPSVPNTLNTAICLEQLSRFDEALDLYEELLAAFAQQLGDVERAAAGRVMARLRSKLGSIDVFADVDGSLVIDGRARGRLPLLSPVRVLPGRHDVRVLKEGYRTFQSAVEVKVGQTVPVDAKLDPLAASGRLRIDAPALAGADVFVDGALVGTTPWEGTLAPGTHLHFVRKGELGTAPKAIVVVKGQTALASIEALALGPELRLVVTPPTAELAIDGVVVGAGRWQGRLPLGEHTIEASEEGYFADKRKLSVDPTAGGERTIRLRADEAHPRWGRRKAGKIWLDAFGGLALSGGFGSQAESCARGRCGEGSAALGFAVGARAGYEFPLRISIEAAGGYLSLGKEMRRSFQGSFLAGPEGAPLQVPTSYDLADEIRISGGFVAAGACYRQPLGRHLELRTHALVGALFAQARDAITGTAAAGGRTLPVAAQGSESGASSTDLFVMPELALGLRFGGFAASVGLAAAAFLLEGPSYQTGDVTVSTDQCAAYPTAIDCAPGADLVSAERAWGQFVVWLPSLSAGYAF